MAGQIKQWDTDWMKQFTATFPTSLSNLMVYPGDPLSWLAVKDIPFGSKVATRGMRVPDQRVNISKDVEYIDKYAKRLVQRVDMPALTDSLRIDEEYYAGDTANALGHVEDLFVNFRDAINNFCIVGTAIDPLAYGFLDQGAGTGTTTIERPDAVDDLLAITSVGAWNTQANMFTDLANMENALVAAGFYGPKIICTHPIVKPFMNFLITSTATPYSTWMNSIGGYPLYFHEMWDSNATKDVVDIFMIDASAYDLYMTPLKVRGFFDDNTEDFVWHWKTRAYLLAKPKWNGTDYQKGQMKMVIDLHS